MIVKILKSIAVGILGTIALFAIIAGALTIGYYVVVVPPLYFVTEIMDRNRWDQGGSTLVFLTMFWIVTLVLPVIIGTVYYKSISD